MKAGADNALAPVAGYLTEEMQTMRELNTPDDDDDLSSPATSGQSSAPRRGGNMRVPTFDIIEYSVLLDSSDMDQQDWLTIAKDIQRYYFLYDGFLIAHGTDTMHFTATALSFLLHNLAKPVILTGAMVPLVEPYNDARRNLVMGMMFAANTEICEVCIFSNDVLLRGNRSVKLRHTLSAFTSPNYPPLAVMQAQPFGVRRNLLLPAPAGPLGIHSDMSGRVMTVLCHPDFDSASVKSMILSGNGTSKSRVDCVVLELMGVGDAVSDMAQTLRSVADAAVLAGSVVVVTVQDLFGSLQSRTLLRARKCFGPNAVFIGDMTTEAAAVKAMYLFGKKLSAKQVAHLMPLNLRGEVTSSISKL